MLVDDDNNVFTWKYNNKDDAIVVRMNDKIVGKIVIVEFGRYQYWPQGKKKFADSTTYDTIQECMNVVVYG